MFGSPHRTVQTARRKFESGDSASALRILDELIANDPFLLSARRLRAEIHFTARKFREAMDDCRVVCQFEQRDYETIALIGDCLLQLNEIDLASAEFMNALNIHPKCRRAIAGLRQISELEVPEVSVPRFAVLASLPWPAWMRPSAQISSRYNSALLPMLYSAIQMVRPSLVFCTGGTSPLEIACVARALDDLQHGEVHVFYSTVQSQPMGMPGHVTGNVEGSHGTIASFEILVRREAEANGASHRVRMHASHHSVQIRSVMAKIGTPQIVLFGKGGNDSWRQFEEIQEELLPGALVIVASSSHKRFAQRLKRQTFGHYYTQLELPGQGQDTLLLMQKLSVATRAAVATETPVALEEAAKAGLPRKLRPITHGT